MILPLHQRLRERLLATLRERYQLAPDALPQLPIEYPPKRELGDLATPVAFELALLFTLPSPAELERSIANMLRPFPAGLLTSVGL